MIKYTIKRILLIAFTLFIILSLTFILLNLLPNQYSGTTDQLRAYYNGQVSNGYYYKLTLGVNNVTELPRGFAFYDAAYNTAYYRHSALTQYFAWLEQVFTKWNWGMAINLEAGTPAFEYVLSRIPVSLSINLVTMIIAVPIGFILGIVAALKKNKPADHIISTGVMVFISVPSFVLITFLLFIFCYSTNLLPTYWPDVTAPLDVKIRGYIIPVFALSLGTICGFARYTRAELCEVMSSDFLLLARTKGLTKQKTITRHALRNSLVPIIPMIVGEFIGILSGSMIIEQLYQIPGNGQIFVKAIGARAYNVLMADMAFYTAIGLLATLIVDLSYGFIDPRIRMGARK